MECTFQVGDRVVCKQRPPICPHCIDRRLEDGVVYTVKAVHVFPSGVICPHGRQYPASPTIRVKELASRAPNDFGHYAWHFRPVKPLSFWLGEKQELSEPVHAHHIGALASASISQAAAVLGHGRLLSGVSGRTGGVHGPAALHSAALGRP